MKRSFGILWLVLMLQQFVLWSQKDIELINPRCLQITENDGLLSNGVNAITQDSSGLIWISTTKGINVYDGRTMTAFTKFRNDSTELPASEVKRIFFPNKEEIWIIYWNDGLRIGNFRTGTSKSYYASQEDTTRLGSNSLQYIFKGPDGNIWASGGGLQQV